MPLRSSSFKSRLCQFYEELFHSFTLMGSSHFYPSHQFTWDVPEVPRARTFWGDPYHGLDGNKLPKKRQISVDIVVYHMIVMILIIKEGAVS